MASKSGSFPFVPLVRYAPPVKEHVPLHNKSLCKIWHVRCTQKAGGGAQTEKIPNCNKLRRFVLQNARNKTLPNETLCFQIATKLLTEANSSNFGSVFLQLLYCVLRNYPALFVFLLQRKYSVSLQTSTTIEEKNCFLCLMDEHT